MSGPWKNAPDKKRKAPGKRKRSGKTSRPGEPKSERARPAVRRPAEAVARKTPAAPGAPREWRAESLQRAPGLAATALPMAALTESLEAAFFGRFHLTRQGWRPARGTAAAGPRPERGGAWRALAEEIMVLHEAYTGREDGFSRAENPIHHRLGGYQFYFLPRNLYRVTRVLDELPWRAINPAVRAEEWLGGRAVFRVLDLGSGSGAFSLAVLAWLAASGAPLGRFSAIELVLVDQARALLEMAQANLAAFAPRALPGVAVTVRTHAEGVSRFLDRPLPEGEGYALVGAAMMLNELGLVGSDRRPRAPRTVERIVRQAAPGGTILLVEPGTRQGYLNLMAVREQVRSLPILYPCPHGEACPMLDQAARRWCHATEALPEGFFFDEALRRKGKLPLRMRELNLAGLAVQAAAHRQMEPPFAPRAGSRAVSALLPSRGPGAAEPVVLLCAPDGRLRERPARLLGPTSRGDWVFAPEGR